MPSISKAVGCRVAMTEIGLRFYDAAAHRGTADA
jgi:hypothetical protein